MREPRGAWVYPVAMLAGLGGLAATAAILLNRGPPAPSVPTGPPPRTQWLGGAVRENIDGLAFMFASENDDASLLVWTLQALAANNFAKQLARTHPQIRSIADMLRSGVQHKIRLYNLDWGAQYDKNKKIKRWAGTSRGREPLSVAWPKFELAERLLASRIDFAELRGRRGERMPPAREWSRINSFLQYEHFGEIVQRQAGEAAETDPDVVVEGWGRNRLVSSVEGLRFYAVGGA